MEHINGDGTSNGMRFVTSNDGTSSIQGKVDVKPTNNSANGMRKGFEAVMATINKLIDDFRIANGRRHNEVVELDAKLDERLGTEVSSLRVALSELNDKLNATPTGTESVDQLREQIDNVAQQVQRLKDVIVKEMRETLSLRGLLETNTERLAELQQQTLDWRHKQFTKQQTSLDAIQTMLRGLQEHTQQAAKQAIDRGESIRSTATQTRESLESLRSEIVEMRHVTTQVNNDAIERQAAMTRENEQLKKDVARLGRRFSTVIGLGFVGVLLIIGAVAAARYL